MSIATLAGILLVFILVALLLALAARRRRRVNAPRDPEHSPFFYIPMGIAAVCSALLILQPDQQAGTVTPADRLMIDLTRDCPPQDDRSTDLVTVTITQEQTEGPPRIVGCARLMKRPYAVAPRMRRPDILVSAEVR